MKEIIPQEVIKQKIFLIRGHRVMLSSHLAELYNVEVRALVQAVKRNIERFPKDFMFQLTGYEYRNLKSQFVISRWGGARRANPYAFTEQGVAMLSSVLNSKRAIQVNIRIMRVFVNVRKMLATHKELADKVNRLEKRIEKHEEETKTVFEVMNKLMIPTTTALISPERPFTNKRIFWDTIRSCEGYIYWIDKYFSRVGLELLSESLDLKKVKKIKILTSIDKVDEKLKDLFKDFKKELKNKRILCELRVIVDNKIKSDIHDRWIISKNVCFNVPSTDTLARGQYSEIKKTNNKPPFDEWWSCSKDIVTEWNEIKKSIC